MDDDPETLSEEFAIDRERAAARYPRPHRARSGVAGPWAAEFSGVIDCMRAPRPVMHRLAMPGELSYFVAFDEPQLDAAGGGPYRKASIWGRYLKSQAPP